ncbi:hypothetical protein [Bartonella vinsonii]|nr:hypothetical protein [Bartonella vinsonii]
MVEEWCRCLYHAGVWKSIEGAFSIVSRYWGVLYQINWQTEKNTSTTGRSH